MSFLVKFLILVAIIWAALMPPLFTNGACTAEFDRESARLAQDQKSLRSPAMADAYWRERSIRTPFSASISVEKRSRGSWHDAEAARW